MLYFDIIVAMDSQRGIGKDGNLPWHIPMDLKHFRTITQRTLQEDKQNAVIMGRKTWESIPEEFRPLKGRINLVLTRQGTTLELPESVLKANSLEGAFNLLKNKELQKNIENIFIIGGGSVFQEALTLPNCRKIFLTKIQKDFHCDTFLPPFERDFCETASSGPLSDAGLEIIFSEWIHKKFL